LNAQARRWVMEEAGVRVHGTTRQKPLVLFALERPLLRPLPAVTPDLGTWHRVVVHRDCHVQFEHALYSVPFTLVGRTLWLRATDTTVALYEDYRHLCTHVRAQRPGERRTVNDHLPPEARAFFARDKHWCLQQARRVGARCTEFIEQLLSDRIAERLRAAQGVIALGSRYGAQRLEAACARALAHGSVHYRTVKTILASNADLQPLLEATTPAAYGRARFVRSAAELFDAKGPLH
jgi:hypothetical protein